MELTTLLPVAQKVNVFCKKCDSDRYHVVLAHVTADSAKIECEVCKKKSKLSLKKKKATATGARTRKAAAAKENSGDKWRQLVSGNNGPATPYNMKSKYTANTKIDHARFGLGVVTTVVGNQIEVVFEDGTRSLIHNRV